ncbi:MAG: N-acetylornithine carbamoyltransferase [Candidatus Cyclobacteriaceae bacterium M3_2C_046]
MKQFYSFQDVDDLPSLLKEAFEIKKNRYKFAYLGKNKSICLLFLNPSLRTRLSTQKAAFNLGLQVVVMDIGKEGWKMEFDDGTVMDGDKAEHIKEAAAVIGQYFDMIGIRAFPLLKDQEEDYQDKVLKMFIKYAGKPVVNLESAKIHPFQSLADLITIEEFKTTEKPKVVLTWAPHPKALPQAVPNSLVEWLKNAPVELIVTHPKGYELSPEFTDGVTVEYDQTKAFEGADFIYAKNWSSFTNYGQILVNDPSWMVTSEKMALTRAGKFMHCLPVRRNVVVQDAVIDSENSLVIPQAANREIAAQVVLKRILENNKVAHKHSINGKT